MGFLGQQYNTADIPEGAGFDPVPAGWYEADIVKAEVKPTKSGDGTRLNIQFKITGPNYIGRVVFAGLNIELPGKAEAERIGREQLGALLRSIGLDAVEDSDELVGYNLRIRVKVREGTDEYPDAQNDVGGFKPAGEAPTMEVPPARPTARTAAPARAATASARPTPAARPQAAPQRAAAPAARAAAPAAAPASGKKPPPWARKK